MAEGFTAAGLDRLREAAEGHVGDYLVPGLVALVARGDQVHVEALGTLSIGGAPVARDSIFRISSTSKPITAAAALAVAGEGLIALDEPVDRLLPELAERRVLRRMDGPLDDTVPAGRAITLRDLLTFTFGFGTMMEMFMSPSPWPVVEAAEALHLATLGPPDPECSPTPTRGSRTLARSRCWRNPANAGCTTRGRRSPAYCSRAPRASPLARLCGRGYSSRSG
jgi:CubicO group peptidase (beta-lactamase class C family)